MLQVLKKDRNSVTVQFTGADLKKWYDDLGPGLVYICHVLGTVVENAKVCSKGSVRLNSHDLIAALKAVVPERFKVDASCSTIITHHMLKRFHSCSNDYAFRTRLNLLNRIPDDHTFTMRFY